MMAVVVSMCISSMMYILNRERAGLYLTFSRMSRTSSMPRFDAPSISSTSTSSPVAMETQGPHLPHGLTVGPFTQLSALEKTRAIEVLPTPLGPVKR